MSIVDRAKNILLSPKTEWPVIAAEPATTGSLITYAAILSLIPLIGSVLSAFLFAGVLGLNFVLTTAIAGYLVGLGVIFVMGLIAGALAPSFDGTNAPNAGLKLIVYASTPVWVLGILNIVPGLNLIAALVGLVYGIYLIYLGSGPVTAVPQAKAGGYTAVVVVIWFILQLVITGVIVGMLATAVVGGAAVGGAMMAS